MDQSLQRSNDETNNVPMRVEVLYSPPTYNLESYRTQNGIQMMIHNIVRSNQDKPNATDSYSEFFEYLTALFHRFNDTQRKALQEEIIAMIMNKMHYFKLF